MRAARCAGRAAAAAATARGGAREGCARGCELRAEPVAARGGFTKNSNSWGGGGAEVGGRLRGQAGSPCAAEAGRGRVGREAGRATGARAQALETHRPASHGPGGTRSAGTPGRAAEARGRTRGRQQDPESRLGWSGGELGAGPAIPPRGRTGCLRGLGFLKRNTPT